MKNTSIEFYFYRFPLRLTFLYFVFFIFLYTAQITFYTIMPDILNQINPQTMHSILILLVLTASQPSEPETLTEKDIAKLQQGITAFTLSITDCKK